MKSVFIRSYSHIRTECGEIRSISPYSAQMRENADQNNSEYGHFLRSSSFWIFLRKSFNLMLNELWSKHRSIYKRFPYTYGKVLDLFWVISYLTSNFIDSIKYVIACFQVMRERGVPQKISYIYDGTPSDNSCRWGTAVKYCGQ